MKRTDYPAKYLDLIDEEIWSFIERTNSFFPKTGKPLTAQERRHYYDEMCRTLAVPHPKSVAASDSIIQTDQQDIPIRRYENSTPSETAQIVYYHGGGFVLGGLDSHDDVCAEICDRTGFAVTAVDYRLAPENPHPADFDDALAAFKHIASTTSVPIVLAGDSAGASLCAAVCHAAGDLKRRIAGQVLIYPLVGLEPQGGSYDEHARAPILSKADIDFFANARCGGDKELERRPSYSPILAESFEDTPPTVSIAAECDPLLDDALAYHEALVQAGSRSHLIVNKGLVHGHLRARFTSMKARDSFTQIVVALETLGQGDWPY